MKKHKGRGMSLRMLWVAVSLLYVGICASLLLHLCEIDMALEATLVPPYGSEAQVRVLQRPEDDGPDLGFKLGITIIAMGGLNNQRECVANGISVALKMGATKITVPRVFCQYWGAQMLPRSEMVEPWRSDLRAFDHLFDEAYFREVIERDTGIEVIDHVPEGVLSVTRKEANLLMKQGYNSTTKPLWVTAGRVNICYEYSRCPRSPECCATTPGCLEALNALRHTPHITPYLNHLGSLLGGSYVAVHLRTWGMEGDNSSTEFRLVRPAVKYLLSEEGERLRKGSNSVFVASEIADEPVVRQLFELGGFRVFTKRDAGVPLGAVPFEVGAFIDFEMCARASGFAGFSTFESTFHLFVEQERERRALPAESFVACTTPLKGAVFHMCTRPVRRGGGKEFSMRQNRVEKNDEAEEVEEDDFLEVLQDNGLLETADPQLLDRVGLLDEVEDGLEHSIRNEWGTDRAVAIIEGYYENQQESDGGGGDGGDGDGDEYSADSGGVYYNGDARDSSDVVVRVVTAASSISPPYCRTFLSVLKYLGRMPDIIGFADDELRHGNHNRKLYHVLQLLQGVPDDELVVFMDAKDVNMNRWDHEFFVDLFRSFRADIVFSGERNCYPKGSWCKKELKAAPQGSVGWYLNSGLFAGYAHAVRRFVQVAQAQDAGERNSDQMQFHQAFQLLKGEMALGLDYHARLFFSLYGNKKRAVASSDESGPDLVLESSGARPFFVHGNANSIDSERRTLKLFTEALPEGFKAERQMVDRITGLSFDALCCTDELVGPWCA